MSLRDEVAKTVHAHQHMSTTMSCMCGWRPTRESSSHPHHVADVIGEVMDLTEEWGVEYEATSTDVVFIRAEDEADARGMAAESPTDTGVRVRLVTKWAEPV